MTKPTIANWIALICLGIIWGGSFMGAKLALISFGPMTVALLRVSLASMVLLIITIASGRKFPKFSTPTYLASYYSDGSSNKFNTIFFIKLGATLRKFWLCWSNNGCCSTISPTPLTFHIEK